MSRPGGRDVAVVDADQSRGMYVISHAERYASRLQPPRRATISAVMYTKVVTCSRKGSAGGARPGGVRKTPLGEVVEQLAGAGEQRRFHARTG
jgi:hypothetical protein